MILSDHSIREELATGRIVIDPLDESCVQPSSVDLHIDRYFRVFRNDTTPFIDPKQAQEDLTELVEVKDGGAFILHPGEFVLGSTLERVALPTDLVARLEGKSSLGRLGLLIHSSLPASENVYVLHDGRFEPRPIGEVVAKELPAHVVAFDRDTFTVGFAPITGWYEGPADRIFEVALRSGRQVRVTAGHNLFTLDSNGGLRKVRTGELRPGVKVAVPHRIPDPQCSHVLDLLDVIPEAAYDRLTCEGPAAARLFDERAADVRAALRAVGLKHFEYYRSRARIPLDVALELAGGAEGLGPDCRIAQRASRSSLPRHIEFDHERARFLGLYVAVGYRRAQQFVVSNTDHTVLDRGERVLRDLGLPVYRTTSSITCCSSLASNVLGWIGTEGKAQAKRVPPIVFGWEASLVAAFLDGLVDGDGSRDPARTSVWTTSDGLVGDLLVLAARHAAAAGTSAYARLERLVDGDLLWDEVVEVRDTGEVEPIYDLEVRPGGRPLENFLAGHGGIFVSNTAGFVDAGWDGHLTLELSNVANLPIAIYPGMKIGQISFLRMTTEADEPYGTKVKGSKYQGQRGPTPSRYYMNFATDSKDEPAG